ncbi:MAG: ImmA/IrrE family metallo-endopeptidase [bacterium]|nr:ImmA/IrrE family metallo-endopeptidase [bacterium]
MNVDKTNIIAKAVALGKETGYVDVVRVANDLNIAVLAAPFEDSFNAQISFTPENGYELLVNENHPIGRQRFSIAHELGHFILHNTEIVELGKLNRDGDSIMEEEADALAAEILMPKELIEDYIRNENEDTEVISKSLIEKIADKFKVSRVVAIIRLRELDYYVPFISLS